VTRPKLSVIVPFLGARSDLAAVASRFAGICTADDELLIVDNSAPGHSDADLTPALDGARVVRAGGVASSYHARNAGAAEATSEWLLFCDADTEPQADLLDAYFRPGPGERTGILAGAVRDHALGDGVAARLARETGAMEQRPTLENRYMPYAITANCAVRAAAFREAGGFEDAIRSGGDADLCWRIQRLGWQLEERPSALVHHRNRETMGALWRQRLRHGAGAAWLERRYPGAMPAWGLAALVRDSGARLAHGARALAEGDRERAAIEAGVVSGWWAFELGRRTSNRAPRR
jgi:GT2 family glycosyltransferase